MQPRYCKGRIGCVTLVSGVAFVLAISACGSGDDGADGRCGDGDCGAGETPVTCAQDCPVTCGDGWCSEPEESHAGCPADCGPCAPLDDVTDLIGGETLFFGYAVLGRDLDAPGCGALAGAKEVIVSWTPAFTGDLVLSTVHPSTHADTVLEVREGSCDGSALACNDDAWPGTSGSKITLPVQAGIPYFALVETDDNEEGIFALSLHKPGVCEGLGEVENITADLLTGRQFQADTGASTAGMRGSCSSAGASESGDAPEVLLSFTAPRTGVMVATTALPGTDFDTLLHVRQGDLGGGRYCGSPEAEVACADDSPPWGTDTVMSFDVLAGRAYDLFVDGAGPSSQGVATLVLGYAAQSPTLASLQGCDHAGLQDQFAFFAQTGQTVFLNADTVDAATAADLRLRLRLPDGSELFEADDDVACTHPPPAYSCPEHSFTADAPGLYFVEVYVGASQSCYNTGLVNYKLTVTVDGEPSDLILVKDQ